ncbi:PPR3A phosphatase, partial [Polypterus senegalus]
MSAAESCTILPQFITDSPMESTGEPKNAGASNFLEVTCNNSWGEDEDERSIKPQLSPLPRRRSSASSDDLEAEAPSVIARKVSFADAFGLDLVSVKEFDTWDVPITSFGEHCEEDIPTIEEYFFSSAFTVPSTKEELMHNVHMQKVALESIEFIPGVTSMKGIIRVLNVCFEKLVYVRMTLDAWSSYYDILAEYIPGSSDGETDQFSFKILLVPPYQKEGAKIEFCIRKENSISYDGTVVHPETPGEINLKKTEDHLGQIDEKPYAESGTIHKEQVQTLDCNLGIVGCGSVSINKSYACLEILNVLLIGTAIEKHSNVTLQLEETENIVSDTDIFSSLKENKGIYVQREPSEMELSQVLEEQPDIKVKVQHFGQEMSPADFWEIGPSLSPSFNSQQQFHEDNSQESTLTDLWQAVKEQRHQNILLPAEIHEEHTFADDIVLRYNEKEPKDKLVLEEEGIGGLVEDQRNTSKLRETGLPEMQMPFSSEDSSNLKQEITLSTETFVQHTSDDTIQLEKESEKDHKTENEASSDVWRQRSSCLPAVSDVDQLNISATFLEDDSKKVISISDAAVQIISLSDESRGEITSGQLVLKDLESDRKGEKSKMAVQEINEECPDRKDVDKTLLIGATTILETMLPNSPPDQQELLKDIHMSPLSMELDQHEPELSITGKAIYMELTQQEAAIYNENLHLAVEATGESKACAKQELIQCITLAETKEISSQLLSDVNSKEENVHRKETNNVPLSILHNNESKPFLEMCDKQADCLAFSVAEQDTISTNDSEPLLYVDSNIHYIESMEQLYTEGERELWQNNQENGTSSLNFNRCKEISSDNFKFQSHGISTPPEASHFGQTPKLSSQYKTTCLEEDLYTEHAHILQGDQTDGNKTLTTAWPGLQIHDPSNSEENHCDITNDGTSTITSSKGYSQHQPVIVRNRPHEVHQQKYPSPMILISEPLLEEDETEDETQAFTMEQTHTKVQQDRTLKMRMTEENDGSTNLTWWNGNKIFGLIKAQPERPLGGRLPSRGRPLRIFIIRRWEGNTMEDGRLFIPANTPKPPGGALLAAWRSPEDQ